jgi:hypothetical protein
MNRSICALAGLVLAATALSSCEMANEQMAYRDQQRRDCAAAGGYFEENKVGSPDNYTCKGVHGGGQTPPTHCHTKTTTTTAPDGTVQTNSTQVCTSL